jgi:Ca2+-binding RTX toxin-like protein
MASIQGTPEADTLVGGNDSDTLLGGAGVDQMTGGDGNDIYYVDSVNDLVNEVGYSQRADGTWKDGGKDTVHTNLAEYTLPANVENLVMGGKNGAEPGTAEAFAGKAGVRHGVGNSERNLMQGDGGAEHFEGLDGDDTLLGGGGNDTLEGGYGWDLLDGGSGADVMNGGDSSDTYIVDDEGDVINDVSSIPDYYPYGMSGIDVMKNSLQTVSLARYKGIEEVQLIGDAALDRAVVGTSGWEKITALDGNDLLQGMGGQDTIYGGGGRDTLTGDALERVADWTQQGSRSNATLYGGSGDDLYVLANGLSYKMDSVREEAGQGRDTVEAHSLFYSLSDKFNAAHMVEDLLFEGQSAWGNELDNRIVGLGTWHQHLRGGLGNDTLVANEVGAMLDGGAGDDVLQSDNASARDLYQWGAGHDVIRDAGGIDRLNLRSVFSGTSVAFSRDGQDLLITSDALKSCRVEGWFDGTDAHQIEFLVLDDGRSVTSSDINSLLSASQGQAAFLPDVAWQLGRDLSSARGLHDAWREDAFSVKGDYYDPGGWNHYLQMTTPQGEAFWRGSDQGDSIQVRGEQVSEVWAAGGDDKIEIVSDPGSPAVLVDGGAGNDLISLRNFYGGSLVMNFGGGSGQDTLSMADSYGTAALTPMTLQLTAGTRMSDVQVRNVQSQGTSGLLSFELYQPSTGDSLKVEGLTITKLLQSDTPYQITDGQSTVALSSLVSVPYVPHDPSQGKVLTSTDALANDVYSFSSQYLSPSSRANAYQVSDAGGDDRLVLGTSVVPTAVGQTGEFLYFRQSAQDLLITIYQRNNSNTRYGSESGSVTVKGWFASPQRQIESIQFGTPQGQRVIENTQVQALVDSMAAWEDASPTPPFGLQAATYASDLALQYSVPFTG